MNTTTNRTDDVERYVEAVRAHLRDLPAADAAELLEDLRQHLAEVASEDDTPLIDRLGPPERYAEELRASAGLDGTERNHTSRLLSRTVASLAALADHPRLRQVRAPGVAWWAGRGYGLALALGVVTTWRSGLSAFPVPNVVGSPALGLVTAAGLVAASVSVGRRAQRGARGWDHVMTLAVLFVGVAAIVNLRTMAAPTAMPHENDVGHYIPEGMLARPDGSVISNIHPYGPDGRPLENVLLYDQDGRPVELTPPHSAEGMPLVTSYPLDRDGRPVMHAYPQRQAFRDPSGDPAYQHGPPEPSPDVPRLADESPAAEPSADAPSPAPSAEPTPNAEVSPGP